MPRRLRAIRPNVGLEIEYRQKLRRLIEKMHNSVVYWLTAAYKKNEPVLAQDSPASELRDIIRRLARQWRANWNNAAEELAAYFARSISRRTDAELRGILRRAGISVDFTITPAMRDVLHATVHQNVALIKSIPQEYLSQVEQAVMRSVQAGRDLRSLTRELEERYNVSRKRAALIARHQNNMATASMTRVRQLELGLGAVWLHSHAGKTPRQQHVEMDGRSYDPRRGMWDRVERRFVFPGELINCRCVSKAVLPL